MTYNSPSQKPSNIVTASFSNARPHQDHLSNAPASPSYYEKVHALRKNSFNTPGILRASWLTPQREEIELLNPKHINFLILNNHLFNVSDDLIFSTYDSYNEKLGWEGCASLELLAHALRAGFITIRFFGGRHSHWEIGVWNLTDPELNKNIIYWAHTQLNKSEFSAPHCPVVIYEHQNKRKRELALKKIPYALRST